MKILVIKTGAIGDVLRSTSILSGLKEKYKNSSITWIVARDAYDIIKANYLIDKIFIFQDIKDIDDRYDLVINLEESRKACELASKANKKKLFGAYLEDGKITYSDNSRSWFDLSLISRLGNKRADILKKENKKSYQRIISDAMGIKVSRPILNFTDKEYIFLERFKKDNNIADGDFVIGVNTNAGERWRYKSLGIEKTIQLIKGMKKEFDAKIVLFGESKDKDRNKKIIQKTKAIYGGCDNSLLEYASLVDLCHILVTSDSLGLHIATALGKKVIAFFGPTSSREIELYGNGIKVLPKMDCLGCYKNDCDFDPTCMDMIEIDEFIYSIKRLR